MANLLKKKFYRFLSFLRKLNRKKKNYLFEKKIKLKRRKIENFGILKEKPR